MDLAEILAIEIKGQNDGNVNFEHEISNVIFDIRGHKTEHLSEKSEDGHRDLERIEFIDPVITFTFEIEDETFCYRVSDSFINRILKYLN